MRKWFSSAMMVRTTVPRGLTTGADAKVLSMDSPEWTVCRTRWSVRLVKPGREVRPTALSLVRGGEAAGFSHCGSRSG